MTGWARWIAVAALIVAGGLPGETSAADELQVSRDGSSWADDYPGVLIDGDVDLVPGGSASGVVYVRNATAGPAELRLAADDIEVGSDGAAHVHLDVAISGGGDEVSASESLGRLAEASDLGVVERVDGGDVRRIDVTLRIDERAPNEAQGSRLRFDLIVQLRDASAVVPGVAGPEPPSGPLPSTGATIAATLVAAAAVAAFGLWLRTAARRRA